MKQSWIVGAIILIIGLQILANIASNSSTVLGTTGGNVNTDTINEWMTPIGTDFSNPVTGMWSVVKDVWYYSSLILKSLTWSYPALFPPGTLWSLAQIFLMAITVGIIFSLISMLRGSPSS